jgi:predicted HicB family RNase H-like nuclease
LMPWPPLSETPSEPQRVITVRLPKSLHESLKVEAHARNISLNELCKMKLQLDIPGAEHEGCVLEIQPCET